MARYRGREITEADLTSIRDLITQHPGASRRRLSVELCRAWQWVQPNGVFRDMVARGLMLHLHRAGLIELPPIRWKCGDPSQTRRRPAPVSLDRTPIEGTLAAIRPLEFRQVRRSAEESLFNGLIEEHHYLGYARPVGEHLKYLVYGGGKTVACLAWSSAPRHLGPRDRYIGWSPEWRRRNLHLLAYNTRFLILPWVKVPHLASHILGWMARELSREWERVYGHPLYLLETFVDPERNRGTCYRAANWQPVGRTTGRGKADLSHRQNRSLKDIWVYPLVRDFRVNLGAVR